MLLIRAAGLGLALVLNILLARTLGPAEYGAYSYGLSLVNVVSVLGVLGLDRLLVRNLATYTAQADWAHLRGFSRWATLITAIMLAGIVALALAVWLLFANELSPLWRTALMTVIAITPVLVFERLAPAWRHLSDRQRRRLEHAGPLRPLLASIRRRLPRQIEIALAHCRARR